MRENNEDEENQNQGKVQDQNERTRLLPEGSQGHGEDRTNFFLSPSLNSIGDIHSISMPDNHVYPYLPSAQETVYPPPMGRKMSRIRTNSVSILNDDGDDVIATSFGPVVMDHAPSSNLDWLLGWFLAIISGVLFTANNFFVKYLSLEALEMLTIRSSMQTIVILITLLSTRTPILPPSNKDRVLVVLQGLLSGVRVFLQFACLSFMPLGDALTLVFTEPLWTIIISKIILKINIGWWKTIFGIFLLSGMVLCIQPPFIFHPLPPSNSSSNNSGFANETDYSNTTFQPLDISTKFTTQPSFYNQTSNQFFNTELSELNLNHTATYPKYTTPNPQYTNTQNINSIFNRHSDAPKKELPSNKIPKPNLLHKFKQITGLDRLQLQYVARQSIEDNDGGGDTPGTGRYYIGVLLALGTAVTGSLANVIIAKCDHVASSVMVFYSGLGGVILGVSFSFMDPDNRLVFDIASIPADNWLVLILLGASGLIGYYAMTRSLQLIPPTTVAVLRALEIILAYVAQAVVMGEIPNPMAISGSSIVMLCVMGFALEDTFTSCCFTNR
ncbi:uncharacterized protein LOC111696300 [Eurytemora carolleeae]|uniref:uncharacterized protein LOC111696300 n=1 Tax=Eurytemora carolleeae TaxID=1294199 RepID=UPI000C778868|nr:uncharacterized protein LOC111696300 [Eurytemora carolleeae]|eukprot:XP_023321638.1 uncharacterized protein LOC111696300 [Eurytemora affinis]